MLRLVRNVDGHGSTMPQSRFCRHKWKLVSCACGGERASPPAPSDGQCVRHASDMRRSLSTNPDARLKCRENWAVAAVCSFPWEGPAGEDVVPIVVSDANGCNLCLPLADKHGHLLPVRLCLLQAGVCRLTVAVSPVPLALSPSRPRGGTQIP